MDDRTIATYCLCDDLVKALHHAEDAQSQMTDAEMMTTAITTASSFAAILSRRGSI